jgi:hypothetical protein
MRWDVPGRRVVLIVALTGLLTGLLAGCVPTATPPMRLSILNGTTLTVTLVVNGTVIDSFASGTGSDGIPASALPALPWAVEARAPSGRVLVSMTVNAGDVWQTTGPNGEVTAKGVGRRADLSCGRLDVWSGPPLMGPAPGSGTPGDCEP